MNDALLDQLDRGGRRGHRHLGRIAQHLLGELGDLLRHGGGEEQRLPFLRELGHDGADVVDEAHVEHAVGFIEHQDFDLAQAQRIAPDQVDEAPGGGDQEVDAVHQCADLPPHGHAADGERGAEAKMPAIGLKAVEDLAGQFAGRAQHQRAAGLAVRPLRVAEEVLQDRQRECRGLAGSGLRDPDHVPA